MCVCVCVCDMYIHTHNCGQVSLDSLKESECDNIATCGGEQTTEILFSHSLTVAGKKGNQEVTTLCTGTCMHVQYIHMHVLFMYSLFKHSRDV